jgi:hypothetical protein
MIKGFIVVSSATLVIVLGANVSSTTNSTDGATGATTVASLHSLDEALVYCTGERDGRMNNFSESVRTPHAYGRFRFPAVNYMHVSPKGERNRATNRLL